MIVTEADKTSWDVGSRMVETVEGMAAELSDRANRLGFILNKNVLPSEAIENFLRRQWECPHIVTVPLDEEAIRYFQEDKVPASDDMETRFGARMLIGVRKLFLSESWGTESVSRLLKLEERAGRVALKRKTRESTEERSETLASWIRIYGTILATGMLGYLGFRAGTGDRLDITSGFVAIGAAIIIFSMTVGDPKILDMFLRAFLPHYRKPKE